MDFFYKTNSRTVGDACELVSAAVYLRGEWRFEKVSMNGDDESAVGCDTRLYNKIHKILQIPHFFDKI